MIDKLYIYTRFLAFSFRLVGIINEWVSQNLNLSTHFFSPSNSYWCVHAFCALVRLFILEVIPLSPTKSQSSFCVLYLCNLSGCGPGEALFAMSCIQLSYLASQSLASTRTPSALMQMAVLTYILKEFINFFILLFYFF